MEVALVPMLVMLVAALVETLVRAVVNEVRLVPARPVVLAAVATMLLLVANALEVMLLMLLEIPVLLLVTAVASEVMLVTLAVLAATWAAALEVMEPFWAVIAAVFEAIATDLTTCYIEFALMLIMFAATLIWRLPISVDWIWFDWKFLWEIIVLLAVAVTSLLMSDVFVEMLAVLSAVVYCLSWPLASAISTDFFNEKSRAEMSLSSV